MIMKRMNRVVYTNITATEESSHEQIPHQVHAYFLFGSSELLSTKNLYCGARRWIKLLITVHERLRVKVLRVRLDVSSQSHLIVGYRIFGREKYSITPKPLTVET